MTKTVKSARRAWRERGRGVTQGEYQPSRPDNAHPRWIADGDGGRRQRRRTEDGDRDGGRRQRRRTETETEDGDGRQRRKTEDGGRRQRRRRRTEDGGRRQRRRRRTEDGGRRQKSVEAPPGLGRTRCSLTRQRKPAGSQAVRPTFKQGVFNPERAPPPILRTPAQGAKKWGVWGGSAPPENTANTQTHTQHTNTKHTNTKNSAQTPNQARATHAQQRRRTGSVSPGAAQSAADDATFQFLTDTK